jgi:hypothetical protein
MHKKKKRSSRKTMQNRRMYKYLQNISVGSRFAGAQQVQPKSKSAGHSASLKRASGRGE